MDTKSKDTVEKVMRRIREVRKQKGFSNDAMVIDLEMSTSAYNKMERMETAITLERFLKIGEILNVPVSELLEAGKGSTYQIQDLKDNAIGHYEVQTLYQESAELYKKLLAVKDEQIEMLKKALENK